MKETKELEDNSPIKNDRTDAHVIALLVKDGRCSEHNILDDIYAELQVGMNERDHLSKDPNVYRYSFTTVGSFFPEFTVAFKDWEGKTSLVYLHQSPFSTIIREKVASEIVRAWREEGILRGNGISKSNLLKGDGRAVRWAHRMAKDGAPRADHFNEPIWLVPEESRHCDEQNEAVGQPNTWSRTSRRYLVSS